MILINCDIGERGADHPIDLHLMSWINIANLACGGHAGDRDSIRVFSALAREKRVQIAAHLSYPDREHFGRLRMEITYSALKASLDEQYALLADARRVKFHGALYNESVRNGELAGVLSGWLTASGIREILAPDDSKLAAACRETGIQVLREAFAERRYEWDEQAGCLVLVDRRQPHASITDLDEALAHSLTIARQGKVKVGHTAPGGPSWHSIRADTICIHSDSPIALPLVRALRRSLAGR